MALQTGRNVRVAFKEESTFNTAPGATDAEIFRINQSPGLNMDRATVLPGEVRSDGLTPMARLGSRSVSGSFTGDLSVNTFDTLLEAVMRSTWTAAVALTSGDFTTAAVASDVVTAGGGSWVTMGLKVGDLVRFTGATETANNNVTCRVIAVTASTFTVASPATGTTLTDAAADGGITITILRKLINGASPTRRSFYIEEYFQDVDQAKVSGGCRCIGFTIRGQPDAMATIEFQFLGSSQTALGTGDSPYFTSPTVTTTDGLVFSDALIRLGSNGDLTLCTGVEITATLGGSTLPVVGTDFTPDVFENQLEVTGQVTVVREDLSYLESFDAETEFDLHCLLQEPLGTPKKALGIYIPRIKFTDAAAPLGGDGAMVVTLPFFSGLQGVADGVDATQLKFSTETP